MRVTAGSDSDFREQKCLPVILQQNQTGPMMRALLFIFASILFLHARSQEFSARDLIPLLESSQKKFESYLNKENFSLSETKSRHDTLINVYSWRPSKKKEKEKGKKKEKEENEEPVRNVEIYSPTENFSFTFFTSSKKDFTDCVSLMKTKGFFCREKKSGLLQLFQKRNVWVQASILPQSSGDTVYSFWFNSVSLPSAKTILYADDLLRFNSHEQLTAVFGEKNVVKDIYYFSANETSKCSVLFPRTSRQAVFVWSDEENFRQPDYVLVGSNLKTAGSANFDGLIEENIWRSRQGIYSGMRLSDLIRLNGNDFKFYGVNSRSPFWVVPENTGSLDFAKVKVVLSCLNQTSSGLLKNETINAGEILDDNAGLYVFMLVLSPPASLANR
jgi:hypothetical protein